MAGMRIETEGFNELIAELSALASKMDNGPGIDRALEAGAAPIEQQMLENASKDPKIITGDLHSSIHAYKPQSGGRRGRMIKIGVKASEHAAYYSNPVEWGHGGPAPAPPHPFVRPAFDTRVEEAYGEMKRVLVEEMH